MGIFMLQSSAEFHFNCQALRLERSPLQRASCLQDLIVGAWQIIPKVECGKFCSFLTSL